MGQPDLAVRARLVDELRGNAERAVPVVRTSTQAFWAGEDALALVRAAPVGAETVALPDTLLLRLFLELSASPDTRVSRAVASTDDSAELAGALEALLVRADQVERIRLVGTEATLEVLREDFGRLGDVSVVGELTRGLVARSLTDAQIERTTEFDLSPALVSGITARMRTAEYVGNAYLGLLIETCQLLTWLVDAPGDSSAFREACVYRPPRERSDSG